jgi:peptidyl-prolyl cis-trans isomerase B (cyclophilin B)
VFGEVTEGKDIVDKMRAVATANSGFHQNVPTTDLVITKAVVLE